MDTSSGFRESVWLETSSQPPQPHLKHNQSCDVCIIGAGISGLSTAYNLVQEGKSVIVLEDGQIGSGETGRTSAHLCNALDDRYYALERMHGKDGARKVAESHSAAIDWIEQTAQAEAIDCEFERVEGYLFLPPGGDPEELQREYDAARRAGLDISWVDRAPWRDFDTGRCLLFPRQAQFHPLRYLFGLAQVCRKRGVQIFTGTHAKSIEGKSPYEVLTADGHRVQTTSVVVATNVPIHLRVEIHTKQAAYRTYVIAAAIPANSVPRALYWDTPDPYHYLRIEASARPGEDLLIIGGEDHKTGQDENPERAYGNLETWARERFPNIHQIAYRWSGQVIEPADGLAFIGRSPDGAENIFMVTGDSGNGLTHGTIAGLLISDLIQGRNNPWAALYDPSRKPVHALGTYMQENVNVVPQYLDWLSPGNVKTVQEIPSGEGAIIREGARKLAVYVEPSGEIHAVSAVCPHLQCIVKWNGGEKTWDCPCHGSRFDTEGHVLNGPANTPLQSIVPAKSTV